MDLKTLVRAIPDFPIPGVLFRDIAPILESSEAFQLMLERLIAQMNLSEIDAFIGVESRGFILASALAAKFHKGFIPLRKAGKLPPPFEQKSYALEYGTATLELRRGTGRVAVIDDVLATGGTLQAALDLCQRAGYDVKDVAVLINLKGLNEMKFRGSVVHSVIEY